MTAPLYPVRASEAYSSMPVPYDTGRKEDRGWRTIGQNGNGRELPEYLHDRHIVNSFKAWRTNPLAKRIIEMQVNFILGNGLSVTSEDEEVAAAIYQWWNDSYNRWGYKIGSRLRDLGLYGEWVHRPLVDRTGFVRIADVQPDNIVAVRPDPLDAGEADQLILKEVISPGGVQKDAPVNIIRRRLQVYGDGAIGVDADFTGDLFYFGINKTRDTMRGVGELFTILDYVDVYDDMLFSRAEKVRMMNQFFWDISIDGMTETEIKSWLEKQTDLPPKAGGVFAHNSAITAQAVVPDLKADDHTQDASLLHAHIIGNSGWPGTYFNAPGDAGRAVGAEMAEPALRNVVNLQSYVGELLRFEIDYHLWSMYKRKSFKAPPEEVRYSLTFNKPSARDISRIGPALKNMILGLKEAQSMFALTQAETRAIIVSAANQLSISDLPLEMELPNELKAAALKAEMMAEKALNAKTQPAGTNNNGNGSRPKEDLLLASMIQSITEGKDEKSPSRHVLWGAGTNP